MVTTPLPSKHLATADNQVFIGTLAESGSIYGSNLHSGVAFTVDGTVSTFNVALGDVTSAVTGGMLATLLGIYDVTGSAGNDQISIGLLALHAFTIHASGGSDTYALNGNATLSYASFSAALTVDLDAHSVDGKPGGQADILSSLPGTIVGGSGDDIFLLPAATTVTSIDGGGGSNTLSYADFLHGVTASLATGSGPDVGSFSHFQNLTGSSFADTLTGDGLNNVITSNGGSDSIDGGRGYDTVVLAGPQSSWTITDNHDGTATASNGSSTVSLAGVEQVQFDDATTGLGHHAAADFFGTNQSTTLWQSASGDLWIWTLDGTHTTAYLPITQVGTEWNIVGVGDLDGNAKSDILWQRSTDGMLYFWNMDGTAITGQGGFYAVDPTQWKVIGFDDINGDGSSDLLFQRQSDNLIYGWTMDHAGQIGGQGSVLTADGSAASVAPSGMSLAGLGDVNADGKADAIWHDTNGEFEIWFLNGLQQTGSARFTLDPTDELKGVGDVNGDGTTDLVLENDTTHEVRIELLGRDGMPNTNGSLPLAAGMTVAHLGDYNGDGKADLILHDVDGNYFVWTMAGITSDGSGYIGTALPGQGWQLFG